MKSSVCTARRAMTRSYVRPSPITPTDCTGNGTAALNNVGVESSLRQKMRIFDVTGLVLEDVDENVADDLPLLLRVADAGQSRQEAVLRVDHVQVGVKVIAEGALHRVLLALPQ